MNHSVFVLTVVLLCGLFIFNDSAILRPVAVDIDNKTQALNTPSDDQSYDFIYPDDPRLRNGSSLPPNILANLILTGNDTIEEDEKIGRGAIKTILG